MDGRKQLDEFDGGAAGGFAEVTTGVDVKIGDAC